MDKKILDTEPTNKHKTDTVLTEEQARELSQLPHKKPKADIDLLHDADKLKVTPFNDDSLSIISTRRKRIKRSKKLEF